MATRYCVDTSTWIELKRFYPAKSFPTLWNKIEQLIKSGRLISPQEVYNELSKKDDEVFKWVKQHRQLFINLNDEEQIALVSEIQKDFPNLVDPLKETPEADPFVIALSILDTKNHRMFGEECIVVSQEKLKSKGSTKPKIPDVCKYYNVKHFSILDLIENEGWQI
jgi:hypothetical protein